jgi:hypothetical protein
MAARPLPGYLWRISVCVIVFMIGLIVSGIVLPSAGMTSLMLSEIADQQAGTLYILMSVVALVIVLTLVATRLGAPWPARWLIMSALTAVGFSVSTAFEAAFFMTASISPATLVLFLVLSLLLPSLALSAAVTALFPPQESVDPWRVRLHAFFTGRSVTEWIWRFAAAALSFAVINMGIALVMRPFVYAYDQGAFAYATPTMAQNIAFQVQRGLLLTVVSLPVVITWTRSRTGLLVKTGLTLFMLIGGLSMLTAVSLHPGLRILLSVEMLLTTMLYMGALILLLMKREALLAYSVQQRTVH